MQQQDAIAALANRDGGGALAVVTGVDGPSYRPVGATMAVLAEGRRVGSLSSGCIEADIALHAARARESGRAATLRYGRGSPFADIALPCGGGLDILVLPDPDRAALSALARMRGGRLPALLEVDPRAGRLSVAQAGAAETGWQGGVFRVRFDPAPRVLVFGKGPEAETFVGLLRGTGHGHLLLSPDAETRDRAAAGGSPVRQLTRPAFPADLDVDAWTGIVLFFHDHDIEPEILKGALATPAFYIGAQGSRRARDARLLALEAMGVSAEALERLRGPIGLIPSARDPGTLAVSVLAELLSVAMARPATA
jgi:xanthine dehydrogenase accessory factor